MKRTAVVIVIALLLLSSLASHPSAAQSTITVSKNKIISDYPYQLIFQFSASGSSKIKDVQLLYYTNGSSCQTSVAQEKLDFTPAVYVETKWVWDLTSSGVLPPGAEISWQYMITDVYGTQLLTDEQTYLVNDTRHEWNSLTSGDVTLQWYEGSRSFGNALLNVATNSLERIATNAGVKPSGQVWLTIYPTADEVVEVDVHASEWAGGIAYPEYNSSIIAIGPDELSWADAVIPHELAHLVTDAAMFNCKGIWPPTWLGEGLATYAEGETSQDNFDLVTSALENDRLPPLRTLDSGFSSDAGKAGLSYAQTGMVVSYLLDHYGSQKMTDLLASMQSGNMVDKALLAVYGKDTDGIDAEWRISLGYKAQPTLAAVSSSNTAIPTLALWTSAVKSTSTATPPTTPTSLAAVATGTPSPAGSPTPLPASPTAGSSQGNSTSSSRIVALYIIGLACIMVTGTALAIFILIIVVLRRRSTP